MEKVANGKIILLFSTRLAQNGKAKTKLQKARKKHQDLYLFIRLAYGKTMAIRAPFYFKKSNRASMFVRAVAILKTRHKNKKEVQKYTEMFT